MPAQERLGLNEEPARSPPGEQPTESREHGAVRRLQCRTNDLAAKNRHLMTEHDHFDGQVGVLSPS